MSIISYSILQRNGRSLLLVQPLLHSFISAFFSWTDESGIASSVIIGLNLLRRWWINTRDLSKFDQEVIVVDLLYLLWRDTILLPMLWLNGREGCA